MAYDLVIFDCDGVLVDSESITNDILAKYLNEFGTDLTGRDTLRLFRGGALSDCIQYVNIEYGITLPDEFATNFRHRMKVAFEKDLEAVAGVKELIKSLDGRKFCVASNGPMEKMETTLKVTGLAEFFGPHVYSAYQINKWKPDPSLFLHAAKEMGVAPDKSVVIEDSPRGVQAATLAGMDSFGFAVYGNEEKLKAQGSTLFYKMNELIGKI